jgi:hypothetical protein
LSNQKVYKILTLVITFIYVLNDSVIGGSRQLSYALASDVLEPMHIVILGLQQQEVA